MPRKTTDPKLVALLDRREKAAAACERWYARLARAFRALEKHRAQVRRLERRIEKHHQESTP